MVVEADKRAQPELQPRVDKAPQAVARETGMALRVLRRRETMVARSQETSIGAAPVVVAAAQGDPVGMLL